MVLTPILFAFSLPFLGYKVLQLLVSCTKIRDGTFVIVDFSVPRLLLINFDPSNNPFFNYSISYRFLSIQVITKGGLPPGSVTIPCIKPFSIYCSIYFVVPQHRKQCSKSQSGCSPVLPPHRPHRPQIHTHACCRPAFLFIPSYVKPPPSTPLIPKRKSGFS